MYHQSAASADQQIINPLRRGTPPAYSASRVCFDHRSVPGRGATPQACKARPVRGGLSAFPSRHDSSLDLGEAPQREAENRRRGLAQERKLSDVAFDMPFCMRAVLEEDNVAGPV